MLSRDDLLKGGGGTRRGGAASTGDKAEKASTASEKGGDETGLGGGVGSLNELFLIKLRYKIGRLLEVGGNKPLLLNDPDTVYVVYSGKVDVFAVDTENGVAAGPRTHLFRAEVGQALFGIAIPKEGRSLALLAVGVVGTQLLKVRQSRLRQLIDESNYANEVFALVDRWVESLAQGLARGMVPQEYTLIEGGQKFKLDAGRIARPKGGVVWVKQTAGALALMGRAEPELNFTPDECYLPLSRQFWVQATAAGTGLESLSTEAFVRKQKDTFALDHFHGVVLCFMVLHAAEVQHAERQRLETKIVANELYLTNSLRRIAAALGVGGTKLEFDMQDERDTLLAACKMVGNALGLDMVAPPSTAGPQRDPLAAIVRASRTRMRRVQLRENWWRIDNGPLLGFFKEGQRPVALVPSTATGGHYVLHEPGQLVPVPVTAEIAARLDRTGYVFYRPFPNRALNAIDLLRFGVRGSERDLLMVLGLGVVGGLLATMTPIATAVLFDTVIPGAQSNQLAQVGMALVVSALVSAIFMTVRSIALLRVEGRMDATIQAAVWDRLLSLPVPFFQQFSAGDLSARAMGINSIRQAIAGTVVSSVLSAVFSSFSFALLFYYDAQLALIATLLVLVAMTVTVIASYNEMRHRRKLSDLQGRISGLVVQFLNGIAKLRVAGVEGHAFGFWAKAFSDQKQTAYRVRMTENALSVFNATYPIITFIVIFASYAFVTEGKLTTGEFLAFNAAFTQFLTSMLTVSDSTQVILSIVPVYERAKPILETMPEVDEAKTDPGDLAGGIEVSHVSFRYRENTPLVLEDISLQIEPGEFVALVGPSGSGKSTLFRLLLGFETAVTGALYYDGKDLSRLDVRSVRRQMGVVLQNGKLAPGDILSNIVGSSGLGTSEAWDAAHMVGLAEDIQRMPMGMHTVIGEGGGTLSGGQRQRLLIARAIITRPRIIFFDEATSALDNRTQAIVSESLERLEATRVVVAHRLSTIINTDRIFVIDNRRLAQSGTYNELINQRGPFATLAKRQLA